MADHNVVPAKAGTQSYENWMPASAGMTTPGSE